MRAGDLRHRVTFQARSKAEDSFGERLNDWSDLFASWAQISPLSGRELLAAQAVQADVTHQVTVRYRPELASPRAVAAMRITYNGRHFNILSSLNEDERNRMVVLTVSEGLVDG